MQTPKSMPHSKISWIPNPFRSRTVKQTSMLYIAQLAGIPLGIITSSIITRSLGPQNYGIYAFCLSVTGFAVIFFRFGISSSSMLLIAQAEDKNEQRQLAGASIFIFAIIGLFYSSFIFIFSFFVDDLFHTNASHILRIVSIVLVMGPMQFLIFGIARGSNKIGILSTYYLIPNILRILGILALLAFSKINIISLIFITAIASTIVKLAIFISLKPSLNDLKRNINRLWAKNREYGIHLYLGQIADQSTYKLDGILISYFVNTTQLGFYSLANTLTLPVHSLSQSLFTTLFRDFARQKKIQPKIIYLNLLWLASCVIGVILLGKYVVVLLFSERFLPVASLFSLMVFASFFQGAYQPYNMFLGAKEKGKWKRNMSFLAAGLNVVGNIILVPIYGVKGAVLASIISRFSSYAAHFFYYNKYLSENK
jgi:O-antigen/teichoic acid export membrane protein